MDFSIDIKLSKEEKDTLKLHLKISLTIISVVGILTLILGYLSSRPFIAAIGSLIACVAVAIIFVIMMYEQRQQLEKIRKPLSKNFEEIMEALNKAESAIEPIREELKKRSSNTLDSTSSSSLNFLSLEWLIENLAIRLEEVYPYLYSHNETNIYIAEELLKKDLIFQKSSSEHLLGHNMPDMPANTWIDSLNFLSSKVMEDLKNIKQRDNSSVLHTIKKS